MTTSRSPEGAPAPSSLAESIAPDTPIERLIAACPAPVRRVISVFRFEARRTRTPSRFTVWWVLALFPVAITVLIRASGGVLAEEELGFILYVLVPQVVCLLGLLLWVASLLQSELEGRTWIYFAVRPGGKLSILIGKFLNGVYWTGTAAWLGLSLAMLVGQPQVAEPLRLYSILCLLIVCACFGYGSVFALIGTLFPRRAMLIAVAYTLIFECLVASIPAIINELTVQHRLFSILWTRMDWAFQDTQYQASTDPIWLHVLVLFGYTVISLIVAGLALRWREYATSEQN